MKAVVQGLKDILGVFERFWSFFDGPVQNWDKDDKGLLREIGTFELFMTILRAISFGNPNRRRKFILIFTIFLKMRFFSTIGVMEPPLGFGHRSLRSF